MPEDLTSTGVGRTLTCALQMAVSDGVLKFLLSTCPRICQLRFSLHQYGWKCAKINNQETAAAGDAAAFVCLATAA